MKVTLDHNVLIDLVNQSTRVDAFRDGISRGTIHPFVVEVGASEFRERGVRPERYDLFEELLCAAGLGVAPRLSPIGIWDVSFWDHALWSDADAEAELDRIEEILFGDSQPSDVGSRVWVNRKCDILSMWCHIHYGNDCFVTSDGNYHKATKMPRLVELGARRIVRPEEL